MYYQQVEIIVFETCAISQRRPGGHIKLARGPRPRGRTLGSPGVECYRITTVIEFIDIRLNRCIFYFTDLFNHTDNNMPVRIVISEQGKFE